MHKIAIFASGGGSNARQIIHHFANKPLAQVSLVVTNRKEAGVRHHAREAKIKDIWVGKSIWQHSPEDVLEILEAHSIDFIVLAGFLLKVPELILERFKGLIINIHPALLPNYGGSGMYGMHIHRAVKEAGEKYSGITIHQVNSEYDQGEILFQKSIELNPNDSPEEIAAKVLKLEHRYYPEIIELQLNRIG